MKYEKIKDICSKICSGGTPKSNKKEYYNDGNIPWLNTKEIDFNNIYFTEKFITEDGFKNSSAKWIEKDSIIVAMYGATAGKVAINKIPLTTNQACCNLQIDEKKAKYEYVYYYLKQNYSQLASLANGGAQQNLNSLVISNFEIKLPSLEIQNKMAHILSIIDRKIELNNSINENLQKIGLYIIEHEILENAEVHLLRNIIKFIKGKKPKTVSTTKKLNYLPYLTIANLNNQESLYATADDAILTNNDIMMVMDGASSGDVYYSTNGIVASTMAKIKILDKNYNNGYIYFVLKYYNELIKSRQTGSAIPHADKEVVYKLEISKPDSNNMMIYQNILNCILNLNIESKILQRFRDTLLPKLIDGEIDLDKIEV